MAIYVHRNDQQLGPYTVAEVKGQLASGALSLTDHVWWKGQQGWVPLGGSAVLAAGFVDPEIKAAPKISEAAGLSQFSVAALVAGLLFPFSFFTSIPAIVFGHCALADLKEHPRRTGRKMAITGLALGYFFTFLSVAIFGLWLYFHDQVEAAKDRDAVVHSDIFVPVLPKSVPNRPAVSAPPATNAPPLTTYPDQPMAPATAGPATNRAPGR